MLSESNGKLLVLASSYALPTKRFKPINLAVEKMAKLLRTDVEIVIFKKQFKPIYVYYKSGEEEKVPIYCDNGDELDSQTIYSTLKDMIFVLSFHPKHSWLKKIREEFMQFS